MKQPFKPGVRYDAFGNIIFNKASEVPMATGKEFSKAEAAAYGIPEFGRIEIPIAGRDIMRQCVKDIRDLCDRLDMICQDYETPELRLMTWAHAEIRHVSNRCRNRRIPRSRQPG